jgi:hypothetical protein
MVVVSEWSELLPVAVRQGVVRPQRCACHRPAVWHKDVQIHPSGQPVRRKRQAYHADLWDRVALVVQIERDVALCLAKSVDRLPIEFAASTHPRDMKLKSIIDDILAWLSNFAVHVMDYNFQAGAT